MNAHALEVKGVAKAYGPVRALDGVDLSVDAGEFVALLGPNGAGKSTLFQLLTGLYVADGGEIHVAGCDIRHRIVPALASLGIVFQQMTLDLDLTVAANLRFHARLHGMGAAHGATRMAAEVERLGIAQQINDKVRQLSGGTRRRVELARALLHEPKILLMDEPTVGLDPASRRDLLAYVLGLCRDRGLGVLWATHLVEEVEAASKVVILHKGKVLKTGTPAGLLADTGQTSLAAAFLLLTAGGGKP
ncbi:MAG TPA: ABC transporter ATP-binding protein [Candidatus Sulfotelmatobacter sp.]|nr:ABC transporter ATP-binding protein [Candidatus Sulfotelmatobacter sp.]